MTVLEKIKLGFTYFDGGMGTLLQSEGLPPGELPERWNVTRPEVIVAAHRRYIEAGCDIINTNTFGANCLKFSQKELEELIIAAVENAKQARRLSGREDVYIALDIGPTGKLLKPLGELEFERAVDIFKSTVKIGASLGVDLINIETMLDSYETKAAVLAAKESCRLPVFVTNVYDEKGKLMTGADAGAMVAMLEGLGVDALGINCSLAPSQMLETAKALYARASIPVIVSPNAGLPRSDADRTVYDMTAEEFACDMLKIAESGARILGGCCGTTPEFIKALVEITRELEPLPVIDRDVTLVSSQTHAVRLGGAPVIIGERINPTGKKRFKEALREGDISYILGEGIAQQEKKCHILDVNVGLPEIDEKEMLVSVVTQLQSVLDLPLQIDTSDIGAMESAMRLYNGKPMVNSVNGKEQSMDAVFPLIRKYGGVVVALTLDEDGIPDTARGRVEIARKIYKKAAEYGVAAKNIVVDPLTLTVSTGAQNAQITLEAVEMLRSMGIRTVLGVSNVSFGLPQRANLNAAFFTLALGRGLSAAIINPNSPDMLRAYYSYIALSGFDSGFGEYIAFAGEAESASDAMPGQSAPSLTQCVIKGLTEAAAQATQSLLSEKSSESVINEVLIPALDEVGKGFESGKIFLPQLLMAAEAASSAFEVIKQKIRESGGASVKKGVLALATVKGDIHDIGKNIVKVILENYGFEVMDLGKDTPPELIVDTVVKNKLRLCGLSALMTSTVPAMEETIRLLRAAAPECKVVVGGAVLTEEYAAMIGADKYAADAMETVRYAEQLFAGEEGCE